jgi:predicted SAM-dependent methyltransferase
VVAVSIATETPTRLDLACGQNKKDGFFGVDLYGDDADQVVDLLRFPWPFQDDSAEEIHCSHFVEHIPHWRPWFPGDVDGLLLFMDEVWRICRNDAKVEIIHPYAFSSRAFQDPTHTRYINEVTWWYFNRDWREAQKLDHYPVRANFDVGIGNSWMRPDKWSDQVKHPDALGEAAAMNVNVIADLAVTLTAIKE